MGGDDLRNLETVMGLFAKKLVVVTNKTALDSAPSRTQDFELSNIKHNRKRKTLAQIASLFESSKEEEKISDEQEQRKKVPTNLTRTELMLIRERLS
jgi:hypothetical protein